VLEEIGAHEKPTILVFNKIDVLPGDKLELIRYEYPNGVFISAKQGKGLDGLFSKMEEYFKSFDVRVKLRISHSDYGLISKYFEYVTIEKLDSLGDFDFVQISGPESIVLKIEHILNSKVPNSYL